MDTSIQLGIERALALHAWGYDTADWDLFAKGWHEDGELTLVYRDGIDDGAEARSKHGYTVPREGLTTKGRDAIIERFKKGRANWDAQGEQPRHVIHNVLIDETDGDTAKVRCFLLFMSTGPRGVGIFGASVYHDELVRGADGWLIKKRVNLVEASGTGTRI